MKQLKTIAILGAVLIPSVSFAERTGVVPRVSMGYSEYNFNQSGRTGAITRDAQGNLLATPLDFPSVDFDVNFFMYSVGATFFKGNKYLDLSYQTSSTESDTFDADLFGGYSESLSGDRTDYSITAGMKVKVGSLKSKMGVYVGYKVGKSSATGVLSDATASNFGNTNATMLSFKEDGPFFGVNYGWRLGKGLISANIAYAFLSGKLIEENTKFEGTQQTNLNAKSKAHGVSYGIGWNAKFFGGASYSIAVDTNSYTFKDVSDSFGHASPSTVPNPLS
jgi:hypothetical protein